MNVNLAEINMANSSIIFIKLVVIKIQYVTQQISQLELGSKDCIAEHDNDKIINHILLSIFISKGDQFLISS